MQTRSLSSPRFAAIDALRGLAIVMMFVFHFSFDLTYFGFTQQNFYHDPFWLNFRTVIVSTFLTVMGISLYLAHHQQFKRRRYLRRLLVLAACAALVSLSSYFMFPRSMIFFGILHFITAASVLGLLFLRYYWLNLILGVVLIIAGTLIKLPLFDHPGLQWLGMMTHKPVTEDYVPLLPWFGCVLLGIFAANWAYTRENLPALWTWPGKNPIASSLRFAGRHSLIIYMLHQPVFIGLLYATKTILRG